jgi:hypothetical protein
MISRFRKVFRVLPEMHPVFQCRCHPSIFRFGGPDFSGEPNHCGGQTLFFYLCRNVFLYPQTAAGFASVPCRSAIRRYPAEQENPEFDSTQCILFSRRQIFRFFNHKQQV